MATKDTTFAPPLSQLLTASPVLVGSTQIQPQNIVNYPSDPFKFLSGGGDWKPPSAPWAMRAPIINPTPLNPVANTALLFPLFEVTARILVSAAYIVLPTTSGNLDIGIYYTDDSVTYVRAVSKGSVAQGAVTPAKISFAAPTAIFPQVGRKWYGAVAPDNATCQLFLDAGALFTNATNGLCFSKATSFPLPATLTSLTRGANCPTVVFTN